VRAIITKQALQEGWDCPFAYVLCTLAAGRNLAAMTQLVGRVLRLPQVAKTGRPALDACYVLCHDAETGKVVEAIRKSLEGEGMGDLGSAVRGGDADPESPRPVKQQRRGAWQGTRIVVPRVTWVQPDGQRRDLEYDSDVPAGLDWQAAQPAQWVANWAPDAQPRSAQQMALGLELLKGGAPQAAVETGGASTMLDRARVVRALAAPARGWISAAHAPSLTVSQA
jgi:type III restriction enzyme